MPAPPFLQTRRKGRLVIPARGARINGLSIVMGPIFSGFKMIPLYLNQRPHHGKRRKGEEAKRR
jgi:hypothetical protein